MQRLESSLRSLDTSGRVQPKDSAILVQARRDAGAYAALEARALIRALVSEIARFEGTREAKEAVEAAGVRFRSERGLFEREDLGKWLAEREMSAEDFVDAMQDEARLARLEALLGAEIEERLLKELRCDPRWPELAARAQRA
jgi:hypothetical protein